MEVVTKLYIGSNLYDRLRVMASSLFIRINTQKECALSVDRTGNHADRYPSAILVSFKPKDSFG